MEVCHRSILSLPSPPPVLPVPRQVVRPSSLHAGSHFFPIWGVLVGTPGREPRSLPSRLPPSLSSGRSTWRPRTTGLLPDPLLGSTSPVQAASLERSSLAPLISATSALVSRPGSRLASDRLLPSAGRPFPLRGLGYILSNLASPARRLMVPFLGTPKYSYLGVPLIRVVLMTTPGRSHDDHASFS